MTRKLKIILVIPQFVLSGAEVMCQNLILGLKEKGHDVLAVSLYDYHGSINKKLEEAGVTIKYLNKKKGFDSSIYEKIEKIIEEFKPDVVHTNLYIMSYIMPAAIKYGVKVKIHTIHSIANKEVPFIRRSIAHYMYHHKGIVPIALSYKHQNTVCKEYRLGKDKVPIIHNGEDTSHFVAKEDYSFNDVFTIIHVGRFLKNKNQKKIVKAVKRLLDEGKKIKVLFVGEDNTDYGRLVKEQVKKEQLEDSFEFLGERENIETELAKADIFVLPSNYEGLPMTIIEAMSCGLPIIASSVGGIEDMITNNENGLLIEPNSEDLYLAIKQLYSSQEKREKLGRKARESVYKYTREEMTNNYLKEYYRILEERKK